MGNEDNRPLIPQSPESQSHFWSRLLLLCKKRWKLLLPVLLTLVIGISILIGLFCVHSHSEGKYLHFLVFEYKDLHTCRCNLQFVCETHFKNNFVSKKCFFETWNHNFTHFALIFKQNVHELARSCTYVNTYNEILVVKFYMFGCTLALDFWSCACHKSKLVASLSLK